MSGLDRIARRVPDIGWLATWLYAGVATAVGIGLLWRFAILTPDRIAVVVLVAIAMAVESREPIDVRPRVRLLATIGALAAALLVVVLFGLRVLLVGG